MKDFTKNKEENNNVRGFYKEGIKSFPIDNIFNLADPLGYSCTVKSYDEGHSYMIISTMPESERAMQEAPFRFEFSSLLYFEGPLRWQGANICVAKPEQCMSLLRKSKELDVLDDDTLMSTYTLFTLDIPNFQVKILATEALLIKLDKQKGILF